jgi:hypothetical protein
MLNVIADRVAVITDVDDHIIADEAVIDRLTQPDLDVEALRRPIILERRGRPSIDHIFRS